MGNKLSCSCAPLIRKAYRYEDSPWQTSRRRDGHLLRLWAEVFHVSASGAGTVKWQQVSEDLVPVNITCIQDSPECVFHITAYNSQVDKILDVRLVQPGTRIGQASECFVYWKDPMTNDTWGLNFTSPIDAKQFRECCSPSFKFSRKASSSYSLKLEPPNKQKFKTKRKPLSTPASPSRTREPQCTCMTAEQYARLRAQDPRFRGSSTLPRAQTRATDTEGRADKVTAATSSTSLYDNVGATQTGSTQGDVCDKNMLALGTKGTQREGSQTRQMRDRGVQQQSQETSTMTSNTATGPKTVTASVGTQNSSQIVQTETQSQTQTEATKTEGTQAGGTLQMNTKTSSTSTRPPLRDNAHHVLTNTKSVDYSEIDMREMDLRAAHHHNLLNNNISNRRSKSKSTEDMNRENSISLDSNTLKRMLKPMPSAESPVTSPEMGRRRYNYYNNHHHRHPNNNGRHSEPESGHPHPRSAMAQNSRFSGSRSSHEIGRGYPGRGLYLELERGAGGDLSPPSDNVLFDNQCYATTPSSSNGNSDPEQGGHHYGRQRHMHHQNANNTPTPGSPTSRLLLEYEMHLRNTLAKGMDAESYSLHTFEALLTQSMENLEFAESLPGSTQRSPYPSRKRPSSSASINKSSTLPLSHRLGAVARDRERDGYYSDRNELLREREKERERGYLSDHNSSFSSRCASCIGESSRAQWFRHSDGWRSGSSNFGSGQTLPQGHKRSPWDSLPSLRQDSSLNDSGYKSNRADSFEQRGMFDRQDSLRSDYMSDRESSRYGIVQQASIESADSRLCYLTSSELGVVGAHGSNMWGVRDFVTSFLKSLVLNGGGRIVKTVPSLLETPSYVCANFIGLETMVESNSCSRKCGRVCNGETSPEKSLMSKRRRHKTVHFGDNLLLQVCTNANLQSHVSYSNMEPNVQQLFSFIETVLSAWVAEEGLTSQGEVSEMDEKELRKRRNKKHGAKVKRLDIRRLVGEVSKLDGRFLGNLRYRHMHWKGNPNSEGCNELFLRKISDDDRMSLTTAVSDEDDGESVMNSPYKAKQTGTAAASFNCTGAVRKAG
ncbi:Protein still life, isoform SIF type 1-like Protein [Tribolium castaneum]|uniref:Protein still life, isoform SIF type 1-like Protein n=1 Tax=Tribolium castaneum TaxID=7070 RepID=A0A139WH59_TRICA|nr:Protein still life, isoform SIF type 1-like Protein [Tribolium castaneum]